MPLVICQACLQLIDRIANNGGHLVVKQVFSQQEQQAFLSSGLASVPFASSDALLGKGEAFEYALFNRSPEDEDWPETAPLLDSIAGRLCKLVPHLNFNTMWVQRYSNGGFIRPHIDPQSYQGVVAIGVFGSFTGGKLIVGDRQQAVDNAEPGDVILLLANTEPRHPMPLHSVGPVESGERVTVILNAKHWPDKGFSCTASVIARNRRLTSMLLCATGLLFLALISFAWLS